MAQRTLESLGVPDTVLRKIRALGVDTPASLRSMMTAAPDELRRYLGPDGFDLVRRILEGSSSGTPAAEFEPNRVVHGARLDTPRGLQRSEVDFALRDRLFAELQGLLRRDDKRSRDRVRELEAQLDAMLER